MFPIPSYLLIPACVDFAKDFLDVIGEQSINVQEKKQEIEAYRKVYLGDTIRLVH